ncbi:MAG: family 43 glycosylhydrolase, partial [Polyangiaceae bacterium]
VTTTVGDASSDAIATLADGGKAPVACTSTRVTYGDAWIRGASHPADFDDATGLVTWDGTCTDEGANSFATLSNGWKPYFTGHNACVIALDSQPGCVGAPAACTTRIGYGTAWLAPTGHAARFDDVAGRVYSSGSCVADGANSYVALSNGFQPHFPGGASCEVSLSYAQCGGLYSNPVIPTDCPDPGVLYDGSQYVLSCTSGGAANAFPIYVSPDLVSWTQKGNIFPSAAKPAWATGDFWAPEIHKVGSHFVAYFSARNKDGKLSVGAASAKTALGPFTAQAAPLIHDANMGLIDASEFTDSDGTPYVLWKEDGNAIGQPTPIHARKLTADGLSLAPTATATLITNDQAWEGPLVEGPFMIAHGGNYYLFYSGNGYATTKYAVGVAKASSPLGPFTKMAAPMLTSAGPWAGPGHCSVLDTPGGDTAMVFHAWQSSNIGAAPGRLVLTDAITWSAGWPTIPFGPSGSSRAVP